MKRANLLACDFTSAFIAVADGTAVAVYSGDDEQPLWRESARGEVMGLGATDEEIIVLDGSGKVTWWDGEAGESADSLAVDGIPRALAVDADGVAAVLTKRGVQILDPGDEPLELPLREGRCLAWSASGDRIAVGTRSGKVVVFDTESGESVGEVELPDTVTSIAFSPDDEKWLATTGKSIFVVHARGKKFERFDLLDGEKPDCVATSEDGTLVAVRVGSQRVVAFAYPDFEVVGRVTVANRPITGVRFSSRSWLAVSLDLGDASRISLRTGAVRRTEPHGDETRTWKVDVDLPGADRRRKTGRAGKRATRRPAGAAVRVKLPRTEKELDTPSVQSLLLLGSVAVATIIMWGAAKFYCNDHSPISLKPREVGTVELASTPKDAAIEMVHRLQTMQFDRALELTEGEPSTQVEAALHACEKSGKEVCDAKRAAAKDKVLTTAELITESQTTAKARVTSITKGGGTVVYDVDLKRSGPIWTVTRLDKQG